MKYFSPKQCLGSILVFLLVGLNCLTNASAQCGPLGCSPSKPSAAAQPIASLPSPVIASLRSVVRVRHETASGASLGTATLVAIQDEQCYFATCAHLFDEGKGRTLLLKPNRSRSDTNLAEIIALDRRHDVALLRSKRWDLLPVKIFKLPKAGNLIACGFGPNGQMRAIRGPLVGQAVPQGALMPSLRMRGSVRPGDSGGPVLDSLGRLVAIVWGERNGETYAAYGDPLNRILDKIPRPIGGRPPSIPIAAPKTNPRDVKPPWLGQLEGRIGLIEASVGESNRKLSELVNVAQPILPLPKPPQNLPSIRNPRPLPPAQSNEETRGKRTFLSKFATAWRVSEFVLGAVSVGGPVGLGLLVGGYWWKRNKKRLKEDRREADRSAPKNNLVAIESPPPPQRIVPETRYVSYEKDEFAKAHQWASEQLARKFPGSVEMLTSLDSLIRQQLAGSREG